MSVDAVSLLVGRERGRVDFAQDDTWQRRHLVVYWREPRFFDVGTTRAGG